MRDIKFVFAFLALFVTITSASATEIVQLTDDTSSNSFSKWSPDGEKLVYVSSPGWYKAEIWIMDSDGNNKEQVTSGVTGFGLDNPWSPDSTKILYSSLEYWIMPCSWTYDVHTEERKRIDRDFDKSFISTDYLSLIYSTVFKKVYSKRSDSKDNIISCQWVFNGSKLFVVEEEEDDAQKLWLADSDGTNKSLLSALNGHNIRFLWQPDGNSILYVSNESGNYDIWVMNTDGSGKKQLTFTTENEYAMGIGYSSDGNRIVYASRNAFNRTNLSSFEGFFTTIWTMDADGANKKQLMDANESCYYYPSWSPDGTKITVQSINNAGRADIVVMDADGSDMEILTANTSGGAFPEWSPKGDKIAFTSLEGEKSTISLMILDEEWKSAPAKTMLSVPAISQESGKKTPGFGAILTVLTLLSRRSI